MITVRGLSKQFSVSGGTVKALKGLDLDRWSFLSESFKWQKNVQN